MKNFKAKKIMEGHFSEWKCKCCKEKKKVLSFKEYDTYWEKEYYIYICLDCLQYEEEK